MIYYANLFLDIALLRRNPQDLPASRHLLLLTVLAVIASYVLAINARYTVAESLLRAGVDVAFLALFVYALLLVERRPTRFNQAFTALCGTGTLLNLLSWPLFGLLDPGGGFTGVALLLLWALVVWGILVTAHILRHAVERSLVFGVGLAVAYMFGAWAVAALLFGEAG